MILQFDWDRLDVTAAEAIRELLNAKLEEEISRRATLAAGDDALTGVGSSQIESLRVTSIEWGISPPFVEILELNDAHDFSSANSISHDPMLGRQEPTSLLTPFRQSSSVSSQHGCECASELDSLVTGGTLSSMPKRLNTPWMSNSLGQMNLSSFSAKDTLAPFLGPGGLYICLHVTYGGPMRVSVSSVLRHDIPLGPTTLPVRMPLTFLISNMDMDFYLCLNLHHNKCRVWMEPGKLSTSPITRMSIKAVFGERRMHHSHLPDFSAGIPLTGEDLDASGAWTHLGSSHLGSEEDDDAVFTEESVISQFVLSEIRAVLQEKIVYPHFLEFPLFS